VSHPQRNSRAPSNSQPRGAQNGALPAPGRLDAETSTQGSALSHAQIDIALVVVIQAWPPTYPKRFGRGFWRWCGSRPAIDHRAGNSFASDNVTDAGCLDVGCYSRKTVIFSESRHRCMR
jgi:hypothetical protein